MSSDEPYWRLSHAAIGMVLQLEADGLEARFWIVCGWPTTHELAYFAEATSL
jgi:hypothetical protein